MDNLFSKTERNGHYVWSYKGLKLWPSDPRMSDFDIVEIANAISKDCRFGGQIHDFYSVAEHSVIMSFLTADPLAGLLHDGLSEYLLRDMPKPTKRMLPDYNEMEHHLMLVGSDKYGIVLGPQLKELDQRLVADEAMVLFPMEPSWLKQWPLPCLGDSVKNLIKCWDHDTARGMFLRRYIDIVGSDVEVVFPKGVEYFLPRAGEDIWKEYEAVRDEIRAEYLKY